MTVAVFCMGQIPGSIDAAISKITVFFGLSSTSGLYVTTVASVVSVVFSILLGFIAGKKIGFKPLIFFCATVELISAIAPYFASNFAVVLVLRGLFGIGFGGMQSLENTVAAKLISPQKRASIVGLGTFFGFGMNCILQFIGGLLADMGWNYVFLNHLLLFIPYAIVVIGCMKLDFGGKETPENTAQAAKANTGMPSAIYLMWVLMFIVGVLVAPLLIGCSFLSEPIIASATVAGIVAVCFSVGCMVGGISYSALFNRAPKLALPVYLLVMAVGSFGCAATRNIVVLCVFIFFAGIGFSSVQASCMMILSMTAPAEKIVLSSALMMAMFNLGMFLSSPYESLVGAITGDALYLPLYIGTVVLIVLAVLYGMLLRGTLEKVQNK